MTEITFSIDLKNNLTLGKKNDFYLPVNSETYQGEFETEEGGRMLFYVYQKRKK